MTSSRFQTATDRAITVTIVVLLALYGVAVWQGWLVPHAAAHEAPGGPEPAISHYGAVAPFVLMLAAIAILPLAGRASHWWEHNSSKLIVALVLAGATLAYLALLHPAASGERAWDTLVETVLHEYIPFIILLFSLFVISGGIRIEGDLRARPAVNTAFIGVGAVLASFIGTTGAAMLLIRPLLETNSERKHVAHTVVVFIFCVCNCGGLLLPIGDPPLFLGYLNGVPFLWTLVLWKEWLFVNGVLLAAYYLWDRLYHYPRETPRDIARDETVRRPLRIRGLVPNGLLLVGVILAVGLLDASKPLPGTNWHPWPYLREAVQLGLVGLSLAFGSPRVREENQFSYAAINEVAVLFIGIFICMQPAIEILGVRGDELGVDTPREFFWASGSLSSVLDNAPTYLVFFKTAQSLPPAADTLAGPNVSVALLTAISLGAVMMGAMTYIGNGPNFMVKTIAEKSGVKMPSFFGYIVYSFAMLWPVLFVMTRLFL